MFGTASNQAASQSSSVTAVQGNTITRVVDFRRLAEASQRTTDVEARNDCLGDYNRILVGDRAGSSASYFAGLLTVEWALARQPTHWPRLPAWL
ncbi:hypothetical protein MRX96_004597 [Rhipicephalus microplus]